MEMEEATFHALDRLSDFMSEQLAESGGVDLPQAIEEDAVRVNAWMRDYKSKLIQ